jgi:prepilin-type N-terminal cleavage/methylation domain-containing protein
MIHLSARPKARGFTLLEMVLALLIGVVLMYSLYSVLNQQVQQAQGGRLILHEATLARSLLTRIGSDILGTLGAANPKATGSGASSASSGTSSTTMGTTSDSTVVFNNGVYGTSNTLVLTVSKVPRDLNFTQVLGSSAASADPTQQTASLSDLARISYWMVGGGQASPSPSAGLARQELKQATSNDLSSIPPDVDSSTYKLIPEVKDIAFQYFDGVSWNDTWDGTTLGGPTGEIPIGPPSAIKITLTFFRRGIDNTDLPDSTLPQYQHVVAIPAGNNFPATNP